jgi:hypothetical protein
VHHAWLESTYSGIQYIIGTHQMLSFNQFYHFLWFIMVPLGGTHCDIGLYLL